MIEKLIIMLIKHEGLKLKLYKCPANFWTIGVGHNIETNPLTKEQCDYLKCPFDDKKEQIRYLKEVGITNGGAMRLLNDDIEYFNNELGKSLKWFKNANETVKIVLINMAFNLGISGLLKFKKTLSLIEQKKYAEAAKEMLNSAWKYQVKYRAYELSELLETNK